jgi:FkbM family methyltransferase
LRRLAGAVVRGLLGRYGLELKPSHDPYKDMKRLLQGGPIRSLVDGGAYHGTFSRTLAAMFPDATVFAFEPESDSFQMLSKSIEGMVNVVAVNAGLSSRCGSAELHINAALSSSSLSARSAWGEKYYPHETDPVGKETIELLTLDRWALDSGTGGIDLIKLDLQGHELEALRGSTELLRSSVRLVYAEVEFVKLYEHNCLFHEVASFLERQGFDLYQLYNLHTGDDGRLLYGDALFFKAEKGH